MTFPTNDRRINERHGLDAKSARSWGAIWKEGKRVFTEPRQRKGDRPAFVDLGLVAVGSLLGAAMYAAVRFGVFLFLLLSVASSVGAGERIVAAMTCKEHIFPKDGGFGEEIGGEREDRVKVFKTARELEKYVNTWEQRKDGTWYSRECKVTALTRVEESEVSK